MKAQQVNRNDRVVVVVVADGQVSIHPGHIVSVPGSHGSGMEIDNVHKTVVWGDRPFNPNADSADDAHEKSMEVSDPNLLSLDEVDKLKDQELTINWFVHTYPIDVINRIHFALLDLHTAQIV